MEPSGIPGPRTHRTFGDTGGMAERWKRSMTAANSNRLGSTAGIEATRMRHAMRSNTNTKR